MKCNRCGRKVNLDSSEGIDYAKHFRDGSILVWCKKCRNSG